jgi:beta-xylosidase
MGVFQFIYDAIKRIKTPKWLVPILEEIQALLVSALLNIGKEYVRKISDKIIEVENTSMSSREKFENVFKFARKNLPYIKDSVINLIIETLFNLIKSKGFVKITS